MGDRMKGTLSLRCQQTSEWRCRLGSKTQQLGEPCGSQQHVDGPQSIGMDGILREMEQMKKRKGRKDGAEHPSTMESGGKEDTTKDEKGQPGREGEARRG